MPAARYWRIVGIETCAGGDLELSELHLYGASGRLDATATLTSTITPTAGTLAALQDDNLGTTCRFEGAAVRSGGFAFVWDFGAGNTAAAMGLRLGAAAQNVFMAGCTLQYSTDGVQWTFLAAFARYEWPGVGVYTNAAQGDPDNAKVSLLLHFDGENGSTTFTDSSAAPKTITAAPGTAISTASPKFGTGAVVIGGLSGYFQAQEQAFGTADFTVEFLAYIEAGYATLLDNRIVTPSADLVIYDAVGTNVFVLYAAGANRLTASSVSSHSWVHFAICRASGITRFFVNGVQQGGTYSDTNNYNHTTLRFGNNFIGSAGLSGKMDEVRVTLGEARYAANFTPPTAPFLGNAGSAVFVSPTLHTADSAVQIAASSLVPDFSTRRAPALAMARDVEHGGPGTIYGTTKTKGTPNQPTHARVVLLHQRSKQPVREVWSDPITGAFVFEGIDTTQQFLTLAEDAAGNFRPVAASRLAPEVAP